MHGHCMHSYIVCFVSSQLFFAELTLFIRYQTSLNCLSLSYTNLAFCDIMLTWHYLILIDDMSCFYCLYHLLPTHCFEDWWLCICYCSKLMTCHFMLFKMMIWIDDKVFLLVYIWCCHVLYEWVDNPLFLFLCPWAVMTCSIRSDWLKLFVNQIWVWWTVCLDDLLIRHFLHDVLRCLLNFAIRWWCDGNTPRRKRTGKLDDWWKCFY